MSYVSVVSLTILLVCVEVFKCDGKMSERDLAGSGRLIGNRAATPHTVELYIVADYSFYKLWYNRAAGISDTTVRQTTAITNLKKYLGSLVNMADMTYRSLETYGIYVKLVLIEIQVCTSASQSHWTEDIKKLNGSIYQVNGELILDELTKTSASLLHTKPHDHIMLVTAYDLIRPGHDNITGLATVEGVCEHRRVSVVEDSMYADTAQTMAHELGHSLGAKHDGDGNNCTAASNYMMTPKVNQSLTLREWIFSICSAGHIIANIRRLNGNTNNCMTVINNHHPDQQLTEYTKLFFGDLYSADDQCRMAYGPGSYVCRSLYNSTHPYTGMCKRFECHDPQNNTCYQLNAGDHTPCGNHKWCILGECVSDPHARAAIDTCPLGERSEYRYNGHSCTELMKISPQECYDPSVHTQCCESCHNYHNSHVALAKHPDVQCAVEFGSASKFCWGVRLYNKTFNEICSSLFCDDLTNTDQCEGIIAADGTPCGHGKWCFEGHCVASSLVANVPEDCLYGDAIGVVEKGRTCADIIREVPHYCSDGYYRRVCCSSCAKIATNIPGCPYGDTASNGCAGMVGGGCYAGHNAELCCKTCHGLETSYPDCRWGDKATWCATLTPRECYAGHNADNCCIKCKVTYKTNIPGCEYGDRSDSCDRAKCASYDQHSRENVCCKTCHDYVAAIVVEKCMIMYAWQTYGDKKKVHRCTHKGGGRGCSSSSRTCYYVAI